MAVTNKLTDSKLRALKPQEKPYKLSDGGGMYILVNPNGSKWWRLAYRLNGKQQTKSLGVYPAIGLFEARLARDAFDPTPVPAGRTLESVFTEFMKEKKSSLSYKHKALMESRCAPVLQALGALPINSLRARDFLMHLRVIEERTITVARKVKFDFDQCYQYAIAADLAETNPVMGLRGALKPYRGGHRPAVTDPINVGKLLDFIRLHPTVGVITRFYLEIAPHVFVRPSELREAKWSEFDLIEAKWSFKMSKMLGQVNEDLIVPLSSQVLKLLHELYKFTGDTPHLFTSVPGKKVISDMTATQILRRSDWSKVHCVHGWRATALTMLQERLRFPVTYADLQLGHVVKGPNGQAYNRAAFLDDRKVMMQKWSDYLDSLRSV